VSQSAAAPKPAQAQPAQPQTPEVKPNLQVKPNIVDRFLTPHRSQDLANTQANQLDSIRKGIQNGSITEKEAAKLLGQQAQVSRATASATSDGVITASEAAKIRLLQSKAGADVFQAAHNRQRGAPIDRAVAKEQVAQLGSIAQGVRNGSLTGAEANTVLTDQADIAQTVADAQADGELDFIEKQTLGIRQDAASYEIGQEKRDTEKAPHASRR
ncbi:MAG TPA: hypothetical protein VNA24_11220, partial [Hyalangium sp.]|nr:hypothetical protein [Hyalangium sp.]